MNTYKLCLSIFILCFASFFALTACKKQDEINPVKSEISYTEIDWDDLIPEEELLAYKDPAHSIMQSFGFNNIEANMVDSMNDQYIKIPGFIVTLEMQDNAITQFFLVPYFGACIHTPPPPKNQMLYVSTEPFILEDINAPVWVEGKINIEETNSDQMGTSGYTITADNIKLY